VLLKNEGAILPLQPSRDSRIAIIGQFARSPRYQGAGSSQVNPTRLDNALDAIRLAVGDAAHVGFAAGYGVGTTEDDDGLCEQAVALAAEADRVVVFLGLPGSYESEGFDRAHIELPPNQIRLLSSVAAANPEVVVVLANGSAVRVSDWEHHARAVLECWLAGQAGGSAIADLLLGRANPSGRLAETLPRRLEDNPSFLNFPGDSGHVRYGEGIFVGYRAYDRLSQDVSYPFGHGLSYTTFEYSDLHVGVSGRHEDGDLRVSVQVTITNAGDLAGEEVVQLYVRDVDSSVCRPVRELKSFVKVGLEPAESKQVSMDLNSRDLSFWSIRTHKWVLEAGRFEIAVGASSRDLRLNETLSIDAPDIHGPLDQESTLAEWLRDPTGGPALRAAVGVGPDGRARGILGDEELLRVVGSMPLRTIASFSGMGIDSSVVEAAQAAVSAH
jgi:beta-glucosidase